MYDHILIATDGSDLANNGVSHGLALARQLGAKVTIVTATDPFIVPSRSVGAGWNPSASDLASYQSSQKAFADDALRQAGEIADKAGVPVTTKYVPDTYPAKAIIETAKTDGCGLIVMASHGRRGLGRILLGSQTAEVLASSPVPVLVIR